MTKKSLRCLTSIILAFVAMPAAAGAGYVDTLTAMSGLVSYWDLNESSGTTAADSVIGDTIDGNNTGYYIGTGITVGDAGPRPADGWMGFASDNRAPTFTKTPDAKLEMFNVAGYGGQTDLSMVGWFRVSDPDAGSLSNMFGGLQQIDYPRYAFIVTRSPTVVSGYISQDTSEGVEQLLVNQQNGDDPAQWHFLALTYGSGTTGTLYIDGVKVDSATSDTAHGLVSPIAMVFANDIGSTTRALHGQLDELAMFNRALTKTEIENLFVDAGGTLHGPGTTATAPFVQTANALGGLRNHWNFSETSGTTAADVVAANTGTFVNTSGDPVILDQAGPNPTVSHGGYEMKGFEADNTSAQFVGNVGVNHMESQDGQVLGEPEIGTAFADGINQLTMSLWFKNNTSGDGYVAGFAKDASTRYVFSVKSPDASSLTFYTKADNDIQLNVSGIRIDDSPDDWAWHHVVQTWDGTEKRVQIFVDGEIKYNGTKPEMSENLSVPDGFYVGRDVPGGVRNLGGFVDEVMLFDRALSTEEVFELYDSAFFTGSWPAIPGDANGDGKVDVDDAMALATNWQKLSDATWAEGDFNSDGAVDDSDATILATNWQFGVSATVSVPEPGTIALLAGMLAFLLLAGRKRK